MGGRLPALRNSMKSRKPSDGIGISGRGRLTDNEISKLQQYYGLSIGRNMNSVSDMFKAVWAIYFHKLSTDSVPQHGLCLTSPDT
ncbi:putative kolobok-17 hm [Trichonephila clavipes]|nr:putative kolobok-17 hm [Trichonephila clavipes]